MNKYVAIAGPLASGKTTLANLLAARAGWSVLLEDLDEHPFLRDYYGDMPRWAYHTVTAFLIRALALQAPIREWLFTAPLCQDWYFREHYEIYGVHTYDEGLLTEREHAICATLHAYLATHMLPPNLVVVLRASTPIIRNRLLSRGRPSEQAIPDSYVEHLVQRYAAWEAQLKVRHIVIDTDDIDLSRDEEAQERVMSRVIASL